MANRKKGREAALTHEIPPEYDINQESVKNSDYDGKKKIVIGTEYVHPNVSDYKAQRRYTLKLVDGSWKIDKKEVFSSFKEKWLNEIL